MPTTDERQFGLLEQKDLFVKDWRFGAISGAEKTILRDDGNYMHFLPEVEYQSGVYFDTMACVAFSALNCLEIIQNVRGLKVNYSDRFTAKASGTTTNGNYIRNVAESIRLDGVVDEEIYPYPRRQRTPVFTWGNYYKVLTDDLKMRGKRWLEDWDVDWEWVPHQGQELADMLKYGPVQVSVKYMNNPNADGLYTDGGSISRNHMVTLVDSVPGEYHVTFDSYSNSIKKLVWDYDFKWALQYSLTRKTINPMPSIKLPNDVLVQEVEKTGTFGIHLNDKIIVDEEGKLLATWLMRNGGNVDGKVVPMKRIDWESFPKYNLKNELI